MPRNGGGIYSLPSGYKANTGELIITDQHNPPLEDIRDDLNAARPIVAGGTGATTASGARTALSVPSVSDVQSGYIPKIASKTALSALDTATFKAAVLTETSREKLWIWKTGDFSTEEAADTDHVNYIAADGISTSLGCWVAATGDGVTVRTISSGGTGADNASDALDNLGGMAAATYDPNSVGGDAFDQDNMVDGITNKNYTATEQTKLADAVVKSDTSVSGFSFTVDEDDMASDSATLLPTQQSVKANIDLYAVRNVADRTALAASPATIIFNRDAADEKIWIKTSDDISAEITAGDPRYLPTSGDATGASGGFYQAGSVPTGGFWADDAIPARILRLNDKLFIADAAEYDGKQHGPAYTWMGKADDVMPNGSAQPNYSWVERNATLAAYASKGALAICGAAHTKDLPGGGTGTFGIGVSAFAVNDRVTDPCAAQGLYVDAKRYPDAGTTWAAEIEITNYGDYIERTPYGTTGGSGTTFGILVGAGAGSGVNGFTSDVSVGITLEPNGALFGKGIVIGGAALRNETDPAGKTYRTAVAMGQLQQLQWHNSTDSIVSWVKSEALDAAKAMGIVLEDNGVSFKNYAGNKQFAVTQAANTVNYFSLQPAVSGSAAVLTVGSPADSNVTMYIKPKGSLGEVRVSGASAASLIRANDAGLAFYGTSPVARPTGVAVTAAAIHAALVTLGLITA